MYKSNLTNAISDYNAKNPTLRKLTLTSIAKQIGCSQPYLSGIGKSKEFEYLYKSIYLTKQKKGIEKRWFLHVKTSNSILIQRLEAIRKILRCEIYDLIKRG